uniref:Mitochondrial inner membrane protease ATP23 n=1 Tax=Cyanoptyche gloeocystis TaxID=77922 RepID=A0A6T9Z4T6_9EUKA|mmetsp:Transcript_2115/g.3962  ORF Transcript_2115/g.3962 Transcript_2115/m.3962 type:complete len:215 (+) Transcript_2115:55-699(+)|eukprot:CAMPEP_0196656516 /NCGR_PEP_ID=MMETSP1086-20130531/17482_1 /TAXON_ID=77921 /ORGANISM="Cyanoptyche  gloeocystis , Strain SAG4.97" /LENGTH=214 /DNA_ID=CAMNT_0041989289 /DNA_START=54 /DNA_END=698 /DNA_ORIENTATION=-
MTSVVEDALNAQGDHANGNIPIASSMKPETSRAADAPSEARIRCESLKNKALKSPTVKFLLDALKAEGCPVQPSFFICDPCTGYSEISGGFDPNAGIVLCENSLPHGQQQADRAVAHELIHVFDHCRAKVDWTDCRHHACSEIRAANLSGDCHWWQEFQRGNFGISAQHQRCVKRRALLSLAMNPNCTAEQSVKAVDDVWDICFKDHYPFDDIP